MKGSKRSHTKKWKKTCRGFTELTFYKSPYRHNFSCFPKNTCSDNGVSTMSGLSSANRHSMRPHIIIIIMPKDDTVNTDTLWNDICLLVTSSVDTPLLTQQLQCHNIAVNAFWTSVTQAREVNSLSVNLTAPCLTPLPIYPSQPHV